MMITLFQNTSTLRPTLLHRSFSFIPLLLFTPRDDASVDPSFSLFFFFFFIFLIDSFVQVNRYKLDNGKKKKREKRMIASFENMLFFVYSR